MQAKLTTCCPSCKVTFPVTSAQLQAAAGKVRCGLCRHIFNASQHATTTPENDFLIYDEMPLPGNNAETRAESDIIMQGPPTAIPEKDQPETPLAETTLPLPDHAILRSTPEAPATLPRPGKPTWPWLLLSLAACLALLIQYAHFHASELAHTSNYRTWINKLCSISGCKIDLKDSSKITANELVIQSHPTSRAALKVHITLVNSANFQQPFPNLVLIFEDLNGRTIASRSFLPESYLSQPNNMTSMPINQPIYIELDILDPGPTAQSYRLLIK